MRSSAACAAGLSGSLFRRSLVADICWLCSVADEFDAGGGAMQEDL